MKRFFKILKLILGLILTVYSLVIIFMLIFSSKEKRYDFASHLQGVFLSQTMFEILKFQNPESDKIYFEQSVPFNKRGNYFKGFQLLDKAVELNPKGHLGYRGYMKLRFLRDYNGALEDFNRLDSLTPKTIDSPWGEDIDFLRGESYFGLGEYEKAKHHFEKSIQNQGEGWVDVQSFVYIGNIEFMFGNLEQSISFYNRALTQSKYTVEAHLGLAKIYFEKKENNMAESHLVKAVKYFSYKRNDPYNEFLNEVYKNDIEILKNSKG